MAAIAMHSVSFKGKYFRLPLSKLTKIEIFAPYDSYIFLVSEESVYMGHPDNECCYKGLMKSGVGF